MRNVQNSSSHSPGEPPGASRLRQESPKTASVITLIDYDQTHLEERVISEPNELLAHFDNKRVTWINIDRLDDLDMLRMLGKRFHLHPLALEDVLETGQRSKAEQYDDYLFIVAQMLYLEASRLPSSLRRARQSKNRSYSGVGERDKPSPPCTASLQSLFCFSVSFLFNLTVGWSQRCRRWRRRLCCRRGHGHNPTRLKPSCLRFQAIGVFRRSPWRRQVLLHVMLAFSILLLFRLPLACSQSR